MNHALWFLPAQLSLPSLIQAPLPVKTTETLEWRGQYGGDPEEGARVLMDLGRWEGLWEGLAKEPPALDFAKYCAVVAHAGKCPTGGYTLEFLEPVLQGDDLLVRWRVRSPSPESFTTQAITQPWKVKAFPRPKGRVKLEKVVN